MALIKCPECKRKISDMAVSCPHCGFVAGTIIATENKKDETNSTTPSQTFGNRVKYIIHLEWADKVNDYLADIPHVGCLLSGLFMSIFAFVIFAAGLAILFFFFKGLWLIHPTLALVVGAIGFDVIAYCVSYVWTKRKKWFFWLCLTLTILLPLILLR